MLFLSQQLNLISNKRHWIYHFANVLNSTMYLPQMPKKVKSATFNPISIPEFLLYIKCKSCYGGQAPSNLIGLYGATFLDPKTLLFFCLSERLVVYDWYPYSMSGKLTHFFFREGNKSVGVHPPPPPPTHPLFQAWHNIDHAMWNSSPLKTCCVHATDSHV